MTCTPKEPSDAPPKKPLSRSCAHDLRHPAQADQGGACLAPCTSRPCGGRGSTRLHRLRPLPRGAFCPAHMGAALCPSRAPGFAGSPAPRSPAPSHLRTRTTPQPPRRSSPPPARLPVFPLERSRTRDRLGPPNRSPARPGERPRCLKKNTLTSCRPPGRLAPPPAALASGSRALAALAYQARRGEIIVLSEDATILWRFALPRLGWWHRAQRSRLPTRPLSPSHIRREESLKRPAWVRSRSWSRITRGVVLNVIGAVQYGTSRVLSQSVPHCDAQALRHYRHHVMATFRTTRNEVGMAVDRSGIPRAHTRGATLDHDHGTVRFHGFPPHGGHHLHPLEGFWRTMQDALGAGRCVRDLHQLSKRTRQVRMAH